MTLEDCQPGMRILIPTKKGTHPNGLVIASIKPGIYRSYLKVTFEGGRNYNLPRTEPVTQIQNPPPMW